MPVVEVKVLGKARIHYLVGRYEEALTWFERVLEIGPEDVGALYNQMLALGALGRNDEFERVRALYAYHNDDEDAQAVASQYK